MVTASGVRSLLFRLVRGLVVLVGVAVFAVGSLIVLVPETERLLPVEATIRLLGSDYVVVAVVGLAAVALAAVVLLAEAIRGVDESIPPVVESIPSAPRPGATVDRAIDDVVAPDRGAERDRLREAAVRTVVRCEHCSRSAAERRIDQGTWTDDDVAAAYLADGGGESGPVRRALSGDDRIGRTVRAIERVASATDDERDTGPRSRSRSRERDRRGRGIAGTDDGLPTDPADAEEPSGERARTSGRERGRESAFERRREASQGSAGSGGR